MYYIVYTAIGCGKAESFEKLKKLVSMLSNKGFCVQNIVLYVEEE